MVAAISCPVCGYDRAERKDGAEGYRCVRCFTPVRVIGNATPATIKAFLHPREVLSNETA